MGLETVIKKINMMHFDQVHPQFELNNQSLNKTELLEIANIYSQLEQTETQVLGNFLKDWFNDNSKISLQTSGTTGIPKQIIVDKQAMMNSAIATGNFFKLKPGNSALCCLPINFIAGKMMIVRALVLGLKLDIIVPNSNPLNNVNKSYDFVAMSPMQVENSINKLHFVKKLIIGGAKLNEKLEEKLISLETESYETYASTETLTHIAARKVSEKYFKLLPDITITKDDRNCLIINAPRITDQKIITNDVVEIINSHEFLWLGRIDNVINSGGIKFFPEKIEEKLDGKIPYKFFIGGIKDEALGEKIILIIESEKYDLPVDLFKDLDKYEKPKEIFFISKFIETESGKIKRKEILQQISNL